MHFVMTEHVDPYIEAVPMYKMGYFTTVQRAILLAYNL
jgi:hypothetical protein